MAVPVNVKQVNVNVKRIIYYVNQDAMVALRVIKINNSMFNDFIFYFHIVN